MPPVGHESRGTSRNVSTDQGDPRQSGLSSGILAGIGANLPILLLSAVLTVAAILISPKKPFWNDELFSYYLLSAESFETLLGAFHDKLNNSPFAYFGLGWLWGKAFGVTELSLRLLSSIGFSIAAILMWTVLRRAYSFWATTFGCLGVFCTSGVVFTQNADARMYGLFVAGFALTILLFDRLAAEERPPVGLLVLNGFANALVVHTHLLGLFYSGAVALAFSLSELRRGGWTVRSLARRLGVFVSFFVAWASFLFYLPSFLVQADATSPYGWIPRPILSDLTSMVTNSSVSLVNPQVFVLLFVVAGAREILLDRAPVGAIAAQIGPDSRSDKWHLICLAAILVLLPAAVWVLSLLAIPIFYPRYLIPSALGWTILLASGAQRLVAGHTELTSLPKGTRDCWALVLISASAVLLALPLIYAITFHTEPLPGSSDNVYGHQSLPIVVQDKDVFMVRHYYSRTTGRYFYVLDWDSANTSASGRFGIQAYKHMDAFRRAFPSEFGAQVVNSDEFLKSHDTFLVLTDADYHAQCRIDVSGIYRSKFSCPQWVLRRLVGNPEWEIYELGPVSKQSMLLVRRRDLTTGAHP
jgi:hypothetical protein